MVATLLQLGLNVEINEEVSLPASSTIKVLQQGTLLKAAGNTRLDSTGHRILKLRKPTEATEVRTGSLKRSLSGLSSLSPVQLDTQMIP